ncbi:MAG: hypothetical protein ACD_79C00149G0001, partial [uncultured bacterium]
LKVLLHDESKTRIEGLSQEIMDNRILQAAYFLSKQSKTKVIFVSKDINARIKGDAIGLPVMDFENQKVNFDDLYSGWTTLKVSEQVLNTFLKNKAIDKPANVNLYPNEFVLFENEANPKQTALGKYLGVSQQIVSLFHLNMKPWGISARNLQQDFCIELLLCDDIKLVTLVGQAGTGKTLLALATGIQKVVGEKLYSKLLVSRPVIPFGKDIGFLPGDKEEKMRNWMQPIFDNLRYLVGADSGDVENKVDNLLKSRGGKTIEIEALTYIRGRSLPKQYIIIDEAQNLTPHEVKTIISRVGEGTKIILTGDPYQIDSPYLDASSNGLSYAVERMKGQEIFGHITLLKSERSSLASIAANIL